MTEMTLRESRPVPILLWIFGVGGAGFLAGFVGPMVIDPDANQGPLVGIFLSGPSAFALGLLLCVVCRLLRVPAAVQWRIFWVSCAAAVLVTVYFILPEPALRGYVIDARIQGCEPPALAADAAIEYWDKRVTEAPWAPPRPGWQNDSRRMLENDHGLVVDVATVRTRPIVEARKPWNSGRMIALGWAASSEQKSYYVRESEGSCAGYPVGARSLYYTPYDISILTRNVGREDWPPRDPADFLFRAVLEPLPDKYRKLVGE